MASSHHRVSICPRVIAVLVAEAVAEWPVVTGVMGLAHATLRQTLLYKQREVHTSGRSFIDKQRGVDINKRSYGFW